MLNFNLSYPHATSKRLVLHCALLCIVCLVYIRVVQNPSQTHKLIAATKFSDYLGLKDYKKAKKLKHFIHLRLANWPQSLSTYHSISPTVNSGHRLKK